MKILFVINVFDYTLPFFLGPVPLLLEWKLRGLRQRDTKMRLRLRQVLFDRVAHLNACGPGIASGAYVSLLSCFVTVFFNGFTLMHGTRVASVNVVELFSKRTFVQLLEY